MRVVLDTNILVSALWKQDGLEAKVVRLALDGTLVPCASEELWTEYVEVLSRAKFAKLRSAAESLLAQLATRVVRVIPQMKVTWSKDEEDNRVLECLQEAQGTYLITGNLRHFPREWEGARIVNAKEFFDMMQTSQCPNQF